MQIYSTVTVPPDLPLIIVNVLLVTYGEAHQVRLCIHCIDVVTYAAGQVQLCAKCVDVVMHAAGQVQLCVKPSGLVS